MSGELATYITGRYVSFVVYPFSFSEFKMVNAYYTFDQYVQYGGMPFLSSIGFESAVSKNYLQDVFNSVVLKDIVKRNKSNHGNSVDKMSKSGIAKERHSKADLMESGQNVLLIWITQRMRLKRTD